MTFPIPHLPIEEMSTIKVIFW